MKRYLMATLLLFVVSINSVFALGWDWASYHSVKAPDRFAHFLAGNYLTAEFSQWRFANNNRWIGFATMSAVMDIGWEGKDGLTKGSSRFESDGYDWIDVAMNTVGGLYGVRLHDQFLAWIGLKDRVVYPRLSRGMCQRPISELWPVLGRRSIIAVVYVGGCAAYNYSRYGEPFPNRSKFYINPRKSKFLETLNSESSFIIPWVTNAELRPYTPLYYRYPSMMFMVFLFEEVNGEWDDRDVPWFGDREGYKEGDIWTGFVSTNLVTLYDIFFYPKDAACEIRTTVGPTQDGFGLIHRGEQSFWTLSARVPDNGGFKLGFRVSF